MKAYWLNKENNENLIVFFAGWSFDENPFKNIACKNYDVIIIYDYNDLSLPAELNNLFEYKNKILITWSMGVYAAYLHKGLFENFDKKIAINGTIFPVDDKYGIPVKIFELTLKHAQTGLKEKFYKNIFHTQEEYEKYLQNSVQRSIENRVSELENLYKDIKNNLVEYEKFYDYAIVSEFDKIIPPKNQTESHKKNNTPCTILPYGHNLFYNFTSWEEITQLCR